MVKRKKQKGGDYDDGGTSGSPITLAEDIYGVIVYVFQSINDAVSVINTVADLPSDMRTAFSEKGAPNPDNVQIT